MTSGSSVGSGGGISSNALTLGSLTASLTIEPLRPTRETPAITVIRDIHLWNKSKYKTKEELRIRCMQQNG